MIKTIKNKNKIYKKYKNWIEELNDKEEIRKRWAVIETGFDLQYDAYEFEMFDEYVIYPNTYSVKFSNGEFGVYIQMLSIWEDKHLKDRGR